MAKAAVHKFVAVICVLSYLTIYIRIGFNLQGMRLSWMKLPGQLNEYYHSDNQTVRNNTLGVVYRAPVNATTTTTTTTTTTPSPLLGSDVCLQNHRLQLIDEMCMKHFKTKAAHHLVDNLKDAQLRLLAMNFVVADEFGVMACLNWKTGSSTWQWILYNNTAPQPLPPPSDSMWENTVNSAKKAKRMVGLHTFKPEEIRMRFKTYFKFMTVRHPLDRLVSNYLDKLVKHKWYKDKLEPKILKRIRNTNSSEHGVTFKEFIQYISDGGKDIWNPAHWHDQISRCQPCKVDYDYIVRTETQEQDAAYIVQHKLIGRGLHAKAKSTNRPGVLHKLPYFGRYLQEYKDIDDALFSKITLKYKKDFELYGYSYKRSNGTAISKCAIGEDTEACC